MTNVIAGHYVAGVIGASLLRNWFRDGAENGVRIDELRAVLDALDGPELSWVLNPERRELLDGYAEWSATYDGPNPLIDAEQPLVHDLLARHVGTDVRALDAGCGTGRHAAFLAGHGCSVVGVDQSPEMLEIARSTAPTATFHEADLEALPLDDDSIDVAVSSLALCHLPDPSTAIAELGRVVRIGGTVVISDPHQAASLVGGQAFFGFEPGRTMSWVENHYHGASTWLPAFAAAGFGVREVREVTFTDEQIAASPAAAVFPAAMRALLTEVPSFWIWVLERRDRP